MLVKRSKIRTGDGWNRPVMGKERMGWKNIMTRSHDVMMCLVFYIFTLKLTQHHSTSNAGEN